VLFGRSRTDCFDHRWSTVTAQRNPSSPVMPD